MTPIPDDIPLAWIVEKRKHRYGPPELVEMASGRDGFVGGIFDLKGEAEPCGSSFGFKLVADRGIYSPSLRVVEFRTRPTTLARMFLGRPIPLDPKTPAGIVADWLVEEAGVSEHEGVCRLLWWLQDFASTPATL